MKVEALPNGIIIRICIFPEWVKLRETKAESGGTYKKGRLLINKLTTFLLSLVWRVHSHFQNEGSRSPYLLLSEIAFNNNISSSIQ